MGMQADAKALAEYTGKPLGECKKLMQRKAAELAVALEGVTLGRIPTMARVCFGAPAAPLPVEDVKPAKVETSVTAPPPAPPPAPIDGDTPGKEEAKEEPPPPPEPAAIDEEPEEDDPEDDEADPEDLIEF